jgi:hypothetical protein
MVGAQDVALGCHVNDLSKSAGHSGALRRNENLRLAPHLHLHGNDGTKETARLGGAGRILHSGTEKARGSAMKEGSQGMANKQTRLHALEPAMRKRMRWDRARPYRVTSATPEAVTVSEPKQRIAASAL